MRVQYTSRSSFIRTVATPRLFFLPAVHTEKTRIWLAQSQRVLEAELEALIATKLERLLPPLDADGDEVARALCVFVCVGCVCCCDSRLWACWAVCVCHAPVAS